MTFAGRRRSVHTWLICDQGWLTSLESFCFRSVAQSVHPRPHAAMQACNSPDCCCAWRHDGEPAPIPRPLRARRPDKLHPPTVPAPGPRSRTILVASAPAFGTHASSPALTYDVCGSPACSAGVTHRKWRRATSITDSELSLGCGSASPAHEPRHPASLDPSAVPPPWLVAAPDRQADRHTPQAYSRGQ